MASRQRARRESVPRTGRRRRNHDLSKRYHAAAGLSGDDELTDSRSFEMEMAKRIHAEPNDRDFDLRDGSNRQLPRQEISLRPRYRKHDVDQTRKALGRDLESGNACKGL